MARYHICNDCGSTDIRAVKYYPIPPPGEPLKDPFCGIPRWHRDGPITEYLAAIESIDTNAKKRMLAIEAYIEVWPRALTDWEVARIVVDWLGIDDIARRSDIAARCNDLRDMGWVIPTGQRIRDPVTRRPNQLCRLTDRGAEQLGLPPRKRIRRKQTDATA